MKSSPELIVLGSAQDGGMPHAGCLCSNCEAARSDRAFARLPTSVGIVSAEMSLMVDASSAFEQQIHRLWLAGSRTSKTGLRFDPPETIVITHAHTGHYSGLWQLDRSVMAARGVRVLGSAAMVGFLASQEPWAMMQRERFIRLSAVGLETPLRVSPDVEITLLPVPHRSEWGVDTIALLISGPQRTVLYVPDIDQWELWDRDIVELVDGVDVALLDGCFWEPFHIPGVPHPPILESMERLASVAAKGRTRIVFTHLNHSNPACDPASPEAAEVARQGFWIAQEGERFSL